MDHQIRNRRPANGQRASSRLKFVLLGALAPVAFFALPLGAMMFVGPGREAAPVTDAGSTLDCASPRNAWKPACQRAKSNLVREADVTGSINDGSAPSGTIERRAKRRSVAGTPSAQPDPDGVKASSELSGQAAGPERTIVAQADPEPARSEPKPSSAGEPRTWRDPAPSPLPTQTSEPAAPPAPTPSQIPASQGDLTKAAQDQAAKPDVVQAATDPAHPAQAAKPDSPVPNAPASAADAAPPKVAPRSVRSAGRAVSKPSAEAEVAEAEPVQRAPRRELRRAARATPARAVEARRMKERAHARVAEARDVDEPVRPMRRRLRPVRHEETAEAARSESAASIRRSSRRFAHHRRAPRSDDPAISGGLRVSSIQTYFLPDGRRVVVNAPVRPDVVRDLVAQHTARFMSRRAAVAAPAWGGWFGDD